MSLRELFKGIRVSDAKSKHHREGWVNVQCPYCHKGSDEFYLGFNIKHQYFNCWSCGKKPLIKTFDLLLGLSHAELLNMLKNAKKGALIGEKQQPKKPFLLPTNLVPIKQLQQHQEYLKRRGFNWKELFNRYDIQGTSYISKLDNIDFSWRIFIPIYDNNKMVTYQTRAIGFSKLPYIACSKEREIINIKDLLYPEETFHTVFLTEGLMDCWKVRSAGFPAVCGFGVGLSAKQIHKLSKKRVIIFYDGDEAGQKEAQKIKNRIEFINNTLVQIADCPEGKDPGDLSTKKITKILKEYI